MDEHSPFGELSPYEELMFSEEFITRLSEEYRRLSEEYRRLCEEDGDSGPNYLDRRRSYLAVKDAYLDLRRYNVNTKDACLFVFGGKYLSVEQDFAAVKKDFLARKQEYQTSFEKDFESMREFFLGSKRDELTPSVGPVFFSHDVFLNFRGKDVRESLVNHLSQALSKAGLRVFLDSKDLKKGAKIWPSLKRAIEKSAICLPIFSESYAESTWCLQEAAAMLKSPHLIIPMFHGVDPTHVRFPLNKKSPYKKFFEKHYGHPDRHPQEEIDGWKSALQDISSRSGWTMEMGIAQHCDVAVEGIVKDVIDILQSQQK